MYRALIGLFAAVSAVASMLAGLTHGDMTLTAVGVAAVTAGATAYLAASSKNSPRPAGIAAIGACRGPGAVRYP